MATIIIVKNNGAQNVGVEDLGIVISPSSQRDLTEDFSVYQIQSSVDLKAKVSTGGLVVNDGTEDLSIDDGLTHITYQTKYEDHFDEMISSQLYIGTTPPESGNIWINPSDGYTYIYDPVRLKWLTTARQTYVFAKDGFADGIYLRVSEVANADAGYPISKPATIVMLYAISTSGSDTSKQFIIEDNHVQIGSFQYDNDIKYFSNLYDLDLDEGTLLQMFVSADGNKVYNTVVLLEVAWRYVEP